MRGKLAPTGTQRRRGTRWAAGRSKATEAIGELATGSKPDEAAGQEKVVANAQRCHPS